MEYRNARLCSQIYEQPQQSMDRVKKDRGMGPRGTLDSPLCKVAADVPDMSRLPALLAHPPALCRRKRRRHLVASLPWICMDIPTANLVLDS